MVFFSGVVGSVSLLGRASVLLDGATGGGRVEGWAVVGFGDGEFGDAVNCVACSCDGKAATDFVEC